MNIFLLALSTLIGITLGLVMSFVINAILIQVSINAFFNLYYGITFLVLGGGILFRMNHKNKIAFETATPSEKQAEHDSVGLLAPSSKQEVVLVTGENGMASSPASGEMANSAILSPQSNHYLLKVNRCLQILFSLFVISSAILCFTLEQDWFKGVSARSKIPSYSMLSISISFTFIYATVDFIQLMIDCIYKECMKKKTSPQIMVTNLQLYLLMSVSFVVGGLFGAIFGFIDVEDYSKSKFILSVNLIIKQLNIMKLYSIKFDIYYLY